jgi:hypothetical protein
MSLIVDLAALAEGAASDVRGSLTLVAVSQNVFVADEFPFQFAPVFVVVVADDAEGTTQPTVLNPGVVVTAKVTAEGPGEETLFVAQLRQTIQPHPVPNMTPRFQIVAQVPFTASKSGAYQISADIEALDGVEVVATVTANRKFRVIDAASTRAK